MNKLNHKSSLYMMLGASLITLTSIWAAYQGQPNYPPLANYIGVNPYKDARTIVFDNFYQPVGCAFDVYTSHDPNSMVVDVNIPGFLAVQGGTVPDPNGTGYLTEWRFDFVPPDPNQHNVDILTTGSTCRPQIRQGRGIVMVPRFDPNYDYAIGRQEVSTPIAPIDWRWPGWPHIEQGNGGYIATKKHQQRWELLNGLPLSFCPRF